jgi:succinyl-CoA synthetase beta subunit
LDLYEYQGKELFGRVGIPVSEGRLATNPKEAHAAAQELGGQVVVKAQVLTGGRGKAGGIKLADGPDEAEERAREILGLDIRGHVVRKLWIEQASEITKEYYLSVTFDRGAKQPLFMFTTQGGVDIEEVAASSPGALVRLHVDPFEGFQPWQARRLIYGAGVSDSEEQKQITSIVGKLYEAFVSFDAMLCEINPLIVTSAGEVRALDSKFTVDDNALFRHADVAEMRDPEAYPPEERAAREKGVTYVKLDGSVGILANGAGLAMSTLDVVALAGGRAANFCDLGGGGDAQGVVDALEIITGDPQVRSILFNVFGGITRTDEVARGILQALSQMTIEHPIVVRLDGTNAEEGRRLLAEAAPPNLHVEPTMLEAAKRAVELAKPDVWSERAEAYRQSPAHREGPDLDLIVEWAVGLKKALDVATGGGHVARRLREAGLDVTTLDPAAGMQPDVVAPAEQLPFADGSFDLVVSRLGAHHFADVRAAMREMARVAAKAVIVVDNTFGGDALEEAERVRDRSHVRCYTVEQWRELFEDVGLDVVDVRSLPQRIELEPWLERAGCTGEDAARVRELVADRTEDGWVTLGRTAIRGVK